MSRNRLLAVFAAVVVVTLAFLLWQRAYPAKPVSTTAGSTPATPIKTGSVEH